MARFDSHMAVIMIANEKSNLPDAFFLSIPQRSFLFNSKPMIPTVETRVNARQSTGSARCHSCRITIQKAQPSQKDVRQFEAFLILKLNRRRTSKPIPMKTRNRINHIYNTEIIALKRSLIFQVGHSHLEWTTISFNNPLSKQKYCTSKCTKWLLIHLSSLSSCPLGKSFRNRKWAPHRLASLPWPL